MCTFETNKSKITAMNWTGIFNGIGYFFQWTFTFMQGLGNKPNLFFWLLIAVLFLTWLRMQSKFNKEAKQNNKIP